jgi:hypothetical protein
MTHDYKRHGTMTLFAALNGLDGTVIGQNMQRRRHEEFIHFINYSTTISMRGATIRMRIQCRGDADIRGDGCRAQEVFDV